MKICATLIVTLLSLLSSAALAQPEALVQWSHKIRIPEGSDTSKFIGACVDSTGSTYLAFEVRDSISILNAILTSTDSSASLGVVKLTHEGSIAWFKTIRTGGLTVRKLQATTDGCWMWCRVINIFSDSTYGQYESKDVFVTIGSNGRYQYDLNPVDFDLLEVKRNSHGVLLMGRHNSPRQFGAIQLEPDGWFYNPITRMFERDHNLWLAQRDNVGNFVWAHSISGTHLSGYAQTSQEALLALTVTVQDTLLIDSTRLTIFPDPAAIVLRLDLSTGEIKWTQIGGGGAAGIDQLTVAISGKLSLVGGFTHAAKFGWLGSDLLLDTNRSAHFSFVSQFDESGRLSKQRKFSDQFQIQALQILDDGIRLAGRSGYFEIDSVWGQSMCSTLQIVELNEDFKAAIAKRIDAYSQVHFCATTNSIVVLTSEYDFSILGEVRQYDLAKLQPTKWEQVGRHLGAAYLRYADDGEIHASDRNPNYRFRRTWVSRDDGKTWTLDDHPYGPPKLLPSDGVRWYALIANPPFNVGISTDSGRSFELDSIIYPLYAETIQGDGRNLYLRNDADGGVYMRQGKGWVQSFVPGSKAQGGGTLEAVDSTLYYALVLNDSSKLFRKYASSDVWEEIRSERGDGCYFWTDPKGIWYQQSSGAPTSVSTDMGNSWTDTIDNAIYARDVVDGTLYSLSGNHVYKYDVAQSNWIRLTDSIPTCDRYNSIVVSPLSILVSASKGGDPTAMFRWSKTSLAKVGSKKPTEVEHVLKVSRSTNNTIEIQSIADVPITVSSFDVLGREVLSTFMLEPLERKVLVVPKRQILYFRGSAGKLSNTIKVNLSD